VGAFKVHVISNTHTERAVSWKRTNSLPSLWELLRIDGGGGLPFLLLASNGKEKVFLYFN